MEAGTLKLFVVSSKLVLNILVLTVGSLSFIITCLSEGLTLVMNSLLFLPGLKGIAVYRLTVSVGSGVLLLRANSIAT